MKTAHRLESHKTGNKKYLALAVSALIGSGAIAPVAHSAENWQLEEVKVTARKRSESLQDSPIAVTAFSGEGLEARGVSQLNELQNITPNMTFQNNPSFGGASSAAAIYVRGIGQKEFLPTVDPGVGIYVDGVYVARSVGAIFDLVEIEQVEVLRGPQGTLFGRNTIGGAVNITTVKPDGELHGYVQATAGTDSRQDFKGMINVPFSDSFMGRFSLASLQRDGYVKRSADGLDLGDDNTLIARAAFAWNLSESIDVNFAVDYTEDDENGPPVTLLGINYAGPIDPETPPMATIHNIGAFLQANPTIHPGDLANVMPCIVPPLTGTLNETVPGCYDDRYLSNGQVNNGTAPSYSDTELLTSDLTVTWRASDTLTVKSITAMRDLDSAFGRDGDGSPFTISQFEDDLQQDQFSQEFQLLGNTEDERMNWILGLYYFSEDGVNVNTLDFTASNFISGGSFDNESKAAFAQLGYNITDNLSLTLGVRYTDEEKSFTPDQYILENHFAGISTFVLYPYYLAQTGDEDQAMALTMAHPLAALDAPFMQAGSRILPQLEKTVSIEETTPMVNLSWQINDGLMAYASYSEGFKSGGFSQRVFPPQVAGATAPEGTADIDLIPSFEPEFVESLELGVKYATDDGRLRLNAAVFDTTYDDFQIQVFTSVAPVTKNAASVGIKGGEVELFWAFADGWLLETSAGYTDAEYEELDSVETLIPKSNDLERVPETTYSLALSRDIQLENGSSIIARADWSRRADQQMDTFNTPQIAQDSYSLLNASVSWQSADDAVRVALGGTNLEDEEYLASGIIGDAFQSYESVLSRGREWYLTLQYNFQ